MVKPSFSMTFNLGHVVQIGTLIVAMTIGWMQMDARTSSNAIRLNAIEEIWANETDRIRSIDRRQAINDERMNSILTLLGRIDARLGRIEESGR